MTDPNLPPTNTPPAQVPQAPAYQQAPTYYQQTPPAPQYGQGYGQQAQPGKYNVLAIVSLVSAFFFSLVAVITGHIALSQIKRTGEQGRGLAIAGLVLGYLGILASIIGTIILFAVFLPYMATVDPNTFNSN